MLVRLIFTLVYHYNYQAKAAMLLSLARIPRSFNTHFYSAEISVYYYRSRERAAPQAMHQVRG